MFDLGRLTDEQRQALTLDQPVFVEASAGSGKTAVLVARYLHILAACPDCDPTHILAVTYTRKAAAEMRHRIRHALETTVSDRLEDQIRIQHCLAQLPFATITTIHAFCKEMINEHSHAAGIAPSIEVPSDEDREWAWQRSMNSTLQDLLAKRDPVLQSALSQHSLDTLRDNLSQLHQRDEISRRFTPTDLDTDAPDSSDDLQTLFHRIRDVFQAEKQRMGWLDFPDMIAEMADLVERDVTVAAAIHQQYKFVMVDEFQDTDPRQWQLFQTLFLQPPARNLFLVGDLKQAIYRFRGADPYLFAEVRRWMAQNGGRVIALTQNFRSQQPLITFCNRLFETLFESSPTVDYAPLHAVKQEPDRHVYIGICGKGGSASPSPEEERKGLAPFQSPEKANATAHMRTDATDRPSTSPSPEEERKRLAPFQSPEKAEATAHMRTDATDRPSTSPSIEDEMKGLTPWHVHEKAEDPEVALIVSWIHHMKDKHGATWSDFAILCRKTAGLGRIGNQLQAAGLPIQQSQSQTPYVPRYYQDMYLLTTLLVYPYDPKAWTGVLRSRLMGISDPALVHFHLERQRTTSLATAIANHPDARIATLLQNILTFRKSLPIGIALATLCQQYGWQEPCRLGYTQTATDYAQLIAQIGLWDAHPLLSDSDRLDRLSAWLLSGEMTSPTETLSGIQLMTIHKAKGLEFPFVVVPECGRTFHASRGRKLIISDAGIVSRIPGQDEAFKAQLDNEENQSMDEEKRIFYVACTRAKEELLLTATTKLADDFPEDFVPGSFWDFLAPYANVTPQTVYLELPVAQDLETEMLTCPRWDVFSGPSREKTGDLKGLRPFNPIKNDREQACVANTEEDFTADANDRHESDAATTKETWNPEEHNSASGGADTGIAKTVNPDRTSRQRPPHIPKWDTLMGTIIHQLLAKIWLSPTPPPLTDIPDLIAQHLCQQFGDQAMTTLASLIPALQTHLQTVYQSRLAEAVFASPQKYSEWPFTWVTPGQAPRDGRIDLLFQSDDRWHLVDFKTTDTPDLSPEILQTLIRYQKAAATHLNIPSAQIQTSLFFTGTGEWVGL